MRQRQALAFGGVFGPLGFVAAWVTAGALATGYSPVNEVISRLAAVDAPMRGLMTAGLACFGVAVLGYSVALRDALGVSASVAASASGVATLGAGAFPLGASSVIDLVHVGFATVGSAALALTPLLAARQLAADGHRAAATGSRLVGVLSAGCLATSAFAPPEGLMQRVGLTLAHAWIAASAIAIIRGLRRAATSD
jgi:hypothetical membrane protein